MSENKLLSDLNVSVKIVKEIKMSNLSLTKLKLIAKISSIKDYENMSKDKLLSAFEKSEPVKTIKEIRKENYGSNKKIRYLRSLYESEDDYYKPQKIKSPFDDNYFEYESSGDKDKELSIEEYLNLIRPYLINIIDDHKNEWKTQLTMEIKFIFNKNPDETSTMHIISKTSTILTGYETFDIIEELFDSLLEKYQEKLKKGMKESNHVSNYKAKI